jgi:PAS domain S-box-containing protein
MTGEAEVVDARAALRQALDDLARADSARREAEAALRASTERMQRVLETDAVGMLFFDASGTLVQANDVFLRMSGYSRAELERGELTWQRMTPSEWLPISNEQMAKLEATGRIGPYEKQYFLKDGSRRWMMFAGRDLGDGTVAEYCFDISNRKQAEAALRDSEQNLRGVANIVPDLLWSSEPEGTTTWYNERWLEYTGQSLEEAIGWGWTQAIHPDDRSHATEHYRLAVEGSQALRQEHRIRRRDGIYRWFLVRAEPLRDEHGRVVRMYAAATDIHDQRTALEALQESERRLQRAISIDTVGVLFFSLDGRMQDANAAFLRMCGYSWQELGRLDWDVLTAPEFRGVTQRHATELAERGATKPYEKQMVRKDGSRWWGLFAPTRLRGSGRDTECVEFIVDISERKQLEAEREERLAAEAAERQALLDRVVRAQEEERHHLARELHDEIGQALTGLQLQLAALARGPDAPAMTLEAEQIVRELTARVSTLSVDLRPSALDTLGLLPALLSHVERYHARTGLHIDLRHNGLDRRFPAAVEITAYRVVQEALTNVVRHSGARSASVQVWADDDTLTLAIRDEGHGFDPRLSRGTGGLSGMRERVEFLHGTLTVDTAHEQGTLVAAELPLHDGSVAGIQDDGP